MDGLVDGEQLAASSRLGDEAAQRFNGFLGIICTPLAGSACVSPAEMAAKMTAFQGKGSTAMKLSQFVATAPRGE
jgi:hypothetical protein